MYDDWKLACWEADDDWCDSCTEMVTECSRTWNMTKLNYEDYFQDNVEECCVMLLLPEKEYCKSCLKYQYKCTRTEDMIAGHTDHLLENEKYK